jgi:hypothetical protein
LESSSNRNEKGYRKEKGKEMKLIWCPFCHHLFSLSARKVRKCDCGRYAGKYINQTDAVANKGAIVVGIDNNTFMPAVSQAIGYQTEEERLNFYFAGWIPNMKHDGQVKFLATIQDVEDYPVRMMERIPDISDHRATVWSGSGYNVELRRLKSGMIEAFITTWKDLKIGSIVEPRKWLGDFKDEEEVKKAAVVWRKKAKRRK